ncbi:hypothetical protein MBANPS3_012282, partial [Mucor bainieri]
TPTVSLPEASSPTPTFDDQEEAAPAASAIHWFDAPIENNPFQSEVVDHESEDLVEQRVKDDDFEDDDSFEGVTRDTGKEKNKDNNKTAPGDDDDDMDLDDNERQNQKDAQDAAREVVQMDDDATPKATKVNYATRQAAYKLKYLASKSHNHTGQPLDDEAMKICSKAAVSLWKKHKLIMKKSAPKEHPRGEAVRLLFKNLK